MEPIELTTVSTPDDVRDILGLQARNLPSALTPETMANQGFVTVRHDASVLLTSHYMDDVVALCPRVVVIEYNAGLHPPMSVTVPYQPNRAGDGTNFFGASLEALVRLGAAKGYRIVGCNISGSNAFFVREDLRADHFLEPATAEEHYEPPRHFFSFLLAGPQAPKPGPYVNV